MPPSVAPYGLRWRSSTTFIAATVWLGILVDISGYSIVVPVIPFKLETLGYAEPASLTGWIVAAYAAGLILSSPVVAWIGGRFHGRRLPLLGGLVFMAGATVLFLLAESVSALVIARIMQGFSGTALWSLGLSLASESVPAEKAGTVLGWILTGMTVGSLVGPPIGGVLYERLGYKSVFVFSLCLIAVDFLMRLIVIEKHTAIEYIRNGVEIKNFEALGYPDPLIDGAATPATLVPDEAEKAIPAGDPKEQVETKKVSSFSAFLSFLGSPRAQALLFITTLQGVVVGSLLDTGMTLYLNNQYGLSSLGAGLVFIGSALPALVASPLSGYLTDKAHYGAKYPILSGIAVTIPAYLLLLIHGPLALFVLFLVMLGGGLTFFVTPIVQDLSIVAGNIEGVDVAVVYASFNACYSFGTLIGPIIGGQVIAAVGIQRGWAAIVAIAAGLSLVSLVPIYLYVGGPTAPKEDQEIEVVP